MVDEGDIRLQEVRLTIDQYEMLIQSMVSRSRDVPPLTMRSQRQTRAVPVIALCSYKHNNVCRTSLSSLSCSAFLWVSQSRLLMKVLVVKNFMWSIAVSGN